MRLLVGALAALSLAAPVAAIAADLPVKARPIPVVVYNWTGFYVGGNAGYSWGRATTDQIDTSTSVATIRAFTLGGTEVTTVPGQNIVFPLVTPGPTTVGATSSASKVDGFIGGVQAGYNWQFHKSWLWGLEADFQGSGEKGSVSVCSLAACAAGSAIGTADYKLRWFGTARARLGYLPTETLVLYATGGLAYGRIDANYVSGNDLAGFPFLGASVQATRLGFTVGAGAEGAIDRNWSWKAEYLYMDLGKFSSNLGSATNTVVGPRIPFADNVIQATVTSTTAAQVSTRFTDHILRFGINYRFSEGPVVARY